MGSHINIAVVQRHLDSVGHRLSSQGVADLLRDLGFSVNAEEEDETCSPVQERKPKYYVTKKIADETPLFSSRPFKAVSATCPTATATGVVGTKAVARSARVTSLAAKLDALEAQINEINELQTHLNDKLDTDQWKSSNLNLVSALGSEAEQFRDWAAGKWPNIHECKPISARSNNTRSDSNNTRSSTDDSALQNCQQQQQRQRSRRNTIVVKKRDPVARYQEIQKIWARDPFLCSGAGDGRSSQRKEQGFRERFSAMHDGK